MDHYLIVLVVMEINCNIVKKNMIELIVNYKFFCIIILIVCL